MHACVWVRVCVCVCACVCVCIRVCMWNLFTFPSGGALVIGMVEFKEASRKSAFYCAVQEAWYDCCKVGSVVLPHTNPESFLHVCVCACACACACACVYVCVYVYAYVCVCVYVYVCVCVCVRVCVWGGGYKNDVVRGYTFTTFVPGLSSLVYSMKNISDKNLRRGNAGYEARLVSQLG